MGAVLRTVGGALAIGLAWAVAWAPFALMVGVLIIDPDNSMDEMWPAIGAYPGFLSGVVFCAVLAMAQRGRRLGELPLSRAAAWGALSGALVGLLPFAIATPKSAGVVALGSIAAMSALSAVASVLWLGRGARKRTRERAEPTV